MSDLYHKQLASEAFGHFNSPIGLSRPLGKDTLRIMDEMVAKMPPFPSSFRENAEWARKVSGAK